MIAVKSLTLGGCSGLAAALAVAPFDFVRRGVVTSSSSSIFGVVGVSTVFYAGVFFGIYFPNRKPESTASQFCWAFASAAAASAAELPFDRTKRTLMGGNAKVVFAANALFVPFGAMILVMYDKALIKRRASFLST